MLWMFGTGSALIIVGGSLRLQEHGMVASPGLIWILSPWQRCRQERLTWEFDESSNLVLGQGWSRVVAEVPPVQRDAIDRLLREKLGDDPSAQSVK